MLVERLEARRSRRNIFYNALGSTDFCHEIAADARETLGELKWRVCDRLGVDAEGVRLRRGVRGAHLRAEATTVVGERGAGLIDGCAVYVEEGAPLGASELLVRAYWAEEEEQPFERSRPARSREASPPKQTGHAEADDEGSTRRRSVSWATAAEVVTDSNSSSSRSRSRSHSQSPVSSDHSSVEVSSDDDDDDDERAAAAAAEADGGGIGGGGRADGRRRRRHAAEEARSRGGGDDDDAPQEALRSRWRLAVRTACLAARSRSTRGRRSRS